MRALKGSVLTLLAAAALAPAAAAATLETAAPWPAAPQPAGEESAAPATSFAEAIEVQVVNVDVWVTDRHGRAVTGLRREDFELKVDGERAPITNFFAVEGGRRIAAERLATEGEPAPVAVAPEPEAPPLFLVVFVDNAHLSPFSRMRLLVYLRGFLEQRIERGARVMVASYEGSVKVRQGFTADRRAIDRALDALQGVATSGQFREAERRKMLDDVLYIDQNNIDGHCSVFVKAAADSYARAAYDDVRATVGALSSFIDALAALPGRKALLHLSDGLPLMAAEEAFSLLNRMCGEQATGEGLPELQSSAPPETSNEEMAKAASQDRPMSAKYNGSWAWLDAQDYNAVELFEGVVDHANGSQVTMFTVDGAGARSPSVASAAIDDKRTTLGRYDFIRTANLQDPLQMMATDTGGRAVLNALDLGPALADIGQDLDTYYSLGFAAEGEAGERLHRLEVEVRRPGLRVRHRRSHQLKPIERMLADRTLGTLVFGVEDNPLGVKLEVGEPTRLDESLFVVPIRLRIPLGKLTLVPEADAHRGRLALQVGARDRTGKLAPVRTAEIPLSIPASQLAAARSRYFLYEVKMLMRAGDHEVAVGLRDELGAVASFLLAHVPVAR